jgi:hypothetical protein
VIREMLGLRRRRGPEQRQPLAPPPAQPLPPPQLPVYYCDKDECPRSIIAIGREELKYGCPSCKKDERARASELPPGLKEIAEEGPARVRERRPMCTKHAGMALACFCPGPDCGAAIGGDSATPPLGLWGAVASGKTVCCAILLEAVKQLYNATGIWVTEGKDLREYKKKVRQLHEEGRLPAKTDPGEHSGIVLRLERHGQRRYKVKLTDMDGAYYTEFITSGGVTGDPEHQPQLIHHTRDAIFLVSPNEAGAVGAPAEADLYGVVLELFARWEELGMLAGFDVERADALLRAVVETLTLYRYPVPDPIGGGYRRLAEALCLLLHEREPKRVDQTRRALEVVAESMSEGIDMLGQISGLERQLRTLMFPVTRDDKLDLRLAITITKADLVFGEERELEHHTAAPQAGKGGTDEQWRQALGVCVARAREVIERLEPQLVEFAENKFRQVGYFFVSSLGRDTELFVADDSDGEGGFRIGKRLPIASSGPCNGTRRPEPKGVLTPLLWLMMGE